MKASTILCLSGLGVAVYALSEQVSIWVMVVALVVTGIGLVLSFSEPEDRV